MKLELCATQNEWGTYHRIRDEQIFSPIGIIYDRNHPTLRSKDHFHFILYNHHTIVSIAHVEFLNDSNAALRSLATDLPFQNKGFGRKMMTLLEKWIKSNGKVIIKMHAANRAEGFYRKLGYIDMEFNDQSISNDIVDLGKYL